MRKLRNKRSDCRKVLWYLVGYGIWINGTVPILCALAEIQWNSAFNMPLSGYYMFVILGYLLSTTEVPPPKKWRIGIYITGICCALIHYSGVYFLSMRDGEKNTLLFDYGQFHSFGLAIAVFVFFKSIKWNKIFSESIQNIISRIADSMKSTFNSAKFRENPIEFIKLWGEVGFKHLDTYIDAFSRITIGFWYPDMNYRDEGAFHPYWEWLSIGQNDPTPFIDYTLVKREPVKGFRWHEKFNYTLTMTTGIRK